MLDAAARLFGRQRFHEVRMDDIAAEAEVGKGTLYRYWSDKEQLYLALLDRASGQFLGRLRGEIERGGRPRTRLTRVATAIIEHFDDNPHLFDLIQRAEVMQGAGFPWRETRLELIKMVTGLFQELKAENPMVVRDPELTTLLLLGGLRTVIRFGQKPRPKDIGERIMDVFVGEEDKPTNGGKRKVRATVATL
jgi:AcrR family transcriptional regulator